MKLHLKFLCKQKFLIDGAYEIVEKGFFWSFSSAPHAENYDGVYTGWWNGWEGSFQPILLVPTPKHSLSY